MSILIYVNFWLQGGGKLEHEVSGPNWIEIKLPITMIYFVDIFWAKQARITFWFKIEDSLLSSTFYSFFGIFSNQKPSMFGLTELISSIKSEDQRMVWLKDQYLFLYYQDDLCMGPLAADAIKVNTSVLFWDYNHPLGLA